MIEQCCPYATDSCRAGMHLYANGYRPVMNALLPLLLYCELPCVVLKSFCIEYSEKGAVELAAALGFA